MVEMEERELLLSSLKGYLEELRDTGVDELPYAAAVASVPPPPAAPDAAEVDAPEPAGIAASGDPCAKLVFVLTGPGLAGPSGDLFVNIVKAMGFTAQSAHFLSIAPQAAVPSLRPALRRRIAAVAPDAVVVLGEEAARLLLDTGEPIGKLRGRFFELDGVPVLPSLHPDQMQADASLKRQVWHEMQQVMAHLWAQTLKR